MKDSQETVLVTGGSGYLAIECITQLLRQGYRIKTTVRTEDKQKTVLQALEASNIEDYSHVSFVKADLTFDEGWDEAVKDCDYVLHVASPFPAGNPKDENELIIPARDGALRVLRAAREASVKRVVLTSSFAAVGYSRSIQNHVFTEEDWTDTSAPIAAYIKSKTVAEKAAWNFIAEEGGVLELTVINPVGIFGPFTAGNFSASVEVVIQGILSGTVSESPDFTMGVVDVRDVADLHIIAMKHPDANNQRFIATSDGSAMSFYDVAQLMKTERPHLAQHVAITNATAPQYYVSISNRKAKEILGWTVRSKEEAILASIDSLGN
ncbi:aldehyde reductase [Dyadobacter luteus]|jgi:nucleoside-diphosphate-sugar epimerase|uniref:Aldehyde reductase n=1 Tax=Dyadobacter luteus TaxID=2259619 RepID=A0A3D8YEZ8_9BACT|nr:aldehyde reductase [Dyadobacter luteus]REA63176.1 aldehyde reductase [Dyadobacter luteus]